MAGFFVKKFAYLLLLIGMAEACKIGRSCYETDGELRELGRPWSRRDHLEYSIWRPYSDDFNLETLRVRTSYPIPKRFCPICLDNKSPYAYYQNRR